MTCMHQNSISQTIHPHEYAPLLKSIKRCGKELSLFASRWGDEPLHSVVADDESRFNALNAALQRYQNSKDLADERLKLVSFFFLKIALMVSLHRP